MNTYSIEEHYLGEFHDPINYDLEVDGDHPSHSFYLNLAKQAKGPVLEVASGTGIVALRLAEQGIELTGLEIVPEMLGHAQTKATQRGLNVRFILGDARTFSLGERFKLIYLTGNAFQAFLNNSDQRALLQRIHEHLADDGIFAFETRNPNWQDLTSDPNESEWMSYTNHAGHHVRITETRLYDPIAQVLQWTLFRRWQEAGETKERVTTIAVRYTFPQELNALLETQSFCILHQYGNWDRSPLRAESSSIITVCKRGVGSG